MESIKLERDGQTQQITVGNVCVDVMCYMREGEAEPEAVVIVSPYSRLRNYKTAVYHDGKLILKYNGITKP